MAKPYDQEFKERALRMLTEALSEHASLHAASKHVGGLLGISPDTLRVWHRQIQIDTGARPGVTTDIAAENRRLQRETTRSFGKRTKYSKLRAYFLPRNSTIHERNDHIHRFAS